MAIPLMLLEGLEVAGDFVGALETGAEGASESGLLGSVLEPFEDTLEEFTDHSIKDVINFGQQAKKYYGYAKNTFKIVKNLFGTSNNSKSHVKSGGVEEAVSLKDTTLTDFAQKLLKNKRGAGALKRKFSELEHDPNPLDPGLIPLQQLPGALKHAVKTNDPERWKNNIKIKRQRAQGVMERRKNAAEKMGKEGFAPLGPRRSLAPRSTMRRHPGSSSGTQRRTLNNYITSPGVKEAKERERAESLQNFKNTHGDLVNDYSHHVPVEPYARVQNAQKDWFGNPLSAIPFSMGGVTAEADIHQSVAQVLPYGAPQSQDYGPHNFEFSQRNML